MQEEEDLFQIIGMASPGIENIDYEIYEGDEDEASPTPILVPQTRDSRPVASPNKRKIASCPLPTPLIEAAQELHTSLMSAYSRLFSISELLVTPSSAGTSTSSTEKTHEERFIAAVSPLKAAFTCCRRRGLRAIQSAAFEWRALRHSVAYTMVVWERVS